MFVLVACVVVSMVVFKNNTNPRLVLKDLFKKAPHWQTSGQLTKTRIYQINIFGIVPAGKLSIYAPRTSVENNEEYRILTADAQTFPWVSALYSARTNLVSTMRVQTLSPREFKQITAIQGEPETEKVIFYDQAKGIMKIGKEERTIAPKTQDPLSLIYNLQELDFTSLQSFEYIINTNQKNYAFSATVKPVPISLSQNTAKGYLVKADIRRKDKLNPYHRSKVDIFFLAYQHENVPLVINVFASGFFVNLKLIALD